MTDEEHRCELGFLLTIRAERDSVFDGGAFFDSFYRVADSHNHLNEHSAYRHRAEMNEIVAIVVHSLDYLGNRLALFTDTAKLQKIGQAH